VVADLAVRCGCGAVSGRLRGPADAGTRRVVCYCRDCQAFARFLGREGDILDGHGGTDILQLSPARLVLESGAERLACVRLTARGLMRWHAGCCATPLGNTLATRQLPFVGLPTVALDDDARARLPARRLGVFARDARGDAKPAGAFEGAPATMAFAVAGALLRARLRGDHRRSPFFRADGAPAATPRVLGPAERATLDAPRT
jgi:hypothetical protein